MHGGPNVHVMYVASHVHVMYGGGGGHMYIYVWGATCRGGSRILEREGGKVI